MIWRNFYRYAFPLCVWWWWYSAHMCCCCTLFVYFILYYAFDPPPSSSLIYLFILPLRSSSAPAFLLCLLTSFRIHTQKWNPSSLTLAELLLKMPTGLGFVFAKGFFFFPFFLLLDCVGIVMGGGKDKGGWGVCVFGEKCIRNESTGEGKKIKSGSLARSLVCIGFVGTFYLLLDIPVCVSYRS